MQRKRYSGYKSFSYLEPGSDFKTFELVTELNRVPSTQVPTTAGGATRLATRALASAASTRSSTI